MSQLTLGAVEAVAPAADPTASQWFTPPDLAARIVEWAGVTPGMRVLEPSAGIGRFVLPLVDAGADVLSIDTDPRMGARVCADFLTVPVGTVDLAVMNPPFEGGAMEAHVMRALEWAPRVVALLPAAFMGGAARYAQVWRNVTLLGLVYFTTRPSFGGDQSGQRDFAVFELVRRRVPRSRGERDRVSVEWWDP